MRDSRPSGHGALDTWSGSGVKLMQKLYLPRLCKRMWEGQNTRAQISARTPGRLRAPPEKPRTLQGRRASSQLACRFRMCIRICTERCLPYGTARTGRALAVNEVTVPCARTRCGRRAKNEDFVAARKRAIKRNASVYSYSFCGEEQEPGRPYTMQPVTPAGCGHRAQNFPTDEIASVRDVLM